MKLRRRWQPRGASWIRTETARAVVGMLLAAVAAAASVLLVSMLTQHDLGRLRGALHSTGLGMDTFSSTPRSCALDPQDGRPAGASTSALSLLWLEPHDDHWLRTHDWQNSPDQPLRLDLFRQPGTGRLEGLLRSAKHADPTLLDQGVCSRLELNSQPATPLVPGGRPALRGTLNLDCTVGQQHLTANIGFDHCGL